MYDEHATPGPWTEKDIGILPVVVKTVAIVKK